MTPSPALPPNAWLRWEAVSRVLPTSGSDLLELGCGQGGFGTRFARRYRYVGVDPDAASLEVARRRFEKHGVESDLRLGDIGVVGADEQFDVVCAFEVIEHMEDDTATVASWVRHLRPGGTLVVSAPGWAARFAAWDELAGHYRRYDPTALEEMLTNAGLARVRAVPYGWPAAYVLESIRNHLARRRGVDSAGETYESKTAASGRLLQLPDGVVAVVPFAVTLPFAKLQHLRPGHGPNMLGVGIRPADG